jgi:uncharacterized protein with HEPN domain
MRRDALLLEQMIEAADQARALVERVGVQDLAADRIRRDALLWNFTILGEASAQLSPELREQCAEVAWRQPAGLRNRIVHGYLFAVDVARWTPVDRVDSDPSGSLVLNCRGGPSSSSARQMHSVRTLIRGS